jgi:hypothetical protein
MAALTATVTAEALPTNHDLFSRRATMSKERWNSMEEAEQHYTGEGYAEAKRDERSVDLSRWNDQGYASKYEARVVIWKSRHDGNIYSEEY